MKRLRSRPRSLLAALAVLAAGCGSTNDSASSTTTSRPRRPQSSTASRSALSTDTGGLNDRSFNHLAYVGLQRAETQLGVQTRVVDVEVARRLHPEPERAREAGLRPRDRRRVHRDPGDEGGRQAVPEDALRDRRRLERRRGHLKNVQGLLFKEQEAGYLAGYAAGLAAKAKGGKAVVLGRRPEAAAGRPLHRGVPGGRQGRVPWRQADQRRTRRTSRTRRSARRSR